MPINQIKATILLQIPDDMIVIQRVEYEELQEAQLLGKTWSTKDVSTRLGGKPMRDIDPVLYQYREQIDIRNGGFVKFPRGKGTRWSFKAKETVEFIDKHWAELIESRRKS